MKRWLGLGRRESKAGGEPTTPQLREPVPRLVEVVVDDAYVNAVVNRLGPMVLGRRPAREGGVGLLFEFDATSDAIAERMGRRAVNRIGIGVVSSTALQPGSNEVRLLANVVPISSRR